MALGDLLEKYEYDDIILFGCFYIVKLRVEYQNLDYTVEIVEDSYEFWKNSLHQMSSYRSFGPSFSRLILYVGRNFINAYNTLTKDEKRLSTALVLHLQEIEFSN